MYIMPNALKSSPMSKKKRTAVKLVVETNYFILQDTSAAKDVVQVHNIVAGGAKSRKPFPSKSIESAEGASSQGKSMFLLL